MMLSGIRWVLGHEIMLWTESLVQIPSPRLPSTCPAHQGSSYAIQGHSAERLPRGHTGDPEGGGKRNGEQAQVARGHGAWSDTGEKCADSHPLPAAPLSPLFLRRWVEMPHQAGQGQPGCVTLTRYSPSL